MAAVAVVVVAVVAVAAYMLGPGRSAPNNAAAVFEALPNSSTVTLLEAERQQLIDMNAAAHTLSTTTKPVMVNPSEIINATSGGTSGDGGGGGGVITGPPVDPGTAESIGYNMLPAFGFSQKTQWGCLYTIWMHESGWRWDAENASGAYGIPQSLPGDKMASAGSDWQTNPATQIKWGLGYISQVYGSPCQAWSFWQGHNYY